MGEHEDLKVNKYRFSFLFAFSSLQAGAVIICGHGKKTLILSLRASNLLDTCNGDVSYDEGSLQEVRTVTITMTDVECLRLI